MTTLAISPWRRWARWRRRRGQLRLGPPVKVLSIIGLLIGLDQYTKAQLTTQDWAWHSQSASWLLYPALCILVATPFLLFRPTRMVAVLVLSGAIGNTMSELRFDTIANPVQVQNGQTHIAFNLADVYLFSGFGLSFIVVASLTLTLITRRQPT